MKGRKNKIVLFLVSVVIGGSLGFFLGFLSDVFQMESTLDRGVVSVILLLLGMGISIPLHIILHELGHLILGKISGFDFISYRVGSFHFQKEEGKLVRKKISIPGTGGQCIMNPPADWERPHYLLYLIGGGLFNLITAFVFLLITFLLKEGRGWEFFLGAAITGIFLGISNLMPLTLSGVPTDGKNVQQILKDPLAKRALWLQLKLAAELSMGKSWEDLPEEYFYDFGELFGSKDLYRDAGVMSVSYWLAKDQVFRAEKILMYLRNFKGRYQGVGLINYYLAELELLDYKEDWENFGKLYKEVHPTLKPISSLEDAIYMRYLYRKYVLKNEEKAEKSWNLLLEKAKTTPYGGLVERIIRKEETRRNSSVVMEEL